MRFVPSGVILALAVSAFVATPAAHPTGAVAATSCIRLVAGNFDAPGVETSNLNGEWVRIRSFCASGRAIAGWKIHDYGRIHTYTFPAGFRIGAGKTVMLYTGHGTNTAAKRYWKLDAPVWNNDPPERAYLRNAQGRIVSTWSEF